MHLLYSAPGCGLAMLESSRGAHTDCVHPFEGLLENWKLRWPGHDGGGGGHAAHEKEGCFVHGRRKMMGEKTAYEGESNFIRDVTLCSGKFPS
jgi:hypothetical protein